MPRLYLLLSITLLLAACSRAPSPSPAVDEPPPQTQPDERPENEPRDESEAPSGPEEGEAGGDGDDTTIPEQPKTPEESARCAALVAEANTVYLSPYGNDSAAGTSPATAWQSLERLRAEVNKVRDGTGGVLEPGTQILLERGGIFYGYLDLNNLRGSAAQPYRLSAYCDGDAPILTGFQSITGWTSVGNNTWQADCPGCGDKAYALRLDGELQAFARWPNVGEGDEAGYNYYDAQSNNPLSITDGPLRGQDWTGAEAIIKTYPWILDRFSIDADSGETLSLSRRSDLSDYVLRDGYGYFIQNHPAALDKHGEWTYDAATRKLELYLDSGKPQDYRVEISRSHTLVSVDKSEYLEFADLVLEGSHELALWGRSCAAISLDNVTVRDLGGRGVHMDDCRDISITNSQISNTFDNGLYLAQCSNCSVSENLIQNIAMTPGMGASGDLRYMGVVIGGQNSVFEYNRVLGVGYIPVTAQSYATIRYNEIDDFASVKVDGAGIYTFEATGVTVNNNIVTNGRGSTAGIPWNSTVTNGIYTDQRTSDTVVRDNTFAYSSGSGMKIFTGTNVRLENNTVFAAEERSLEFLERSDAGYHNNLHLSGNIFVQKRAGDPLLRMNTDRDESRFRASGTLTQNTYCAPLITPFVSRNYVENGRWIPYRNSLISFEAWQTYHDADSNLCPHTYPRFNVTGESGDKVSNGTFDANVLGWSRWPDSARFEHTNEGQLKMSVAGELHHGVGSVAAGDTYRLRFDAKSGSELSALRVQLQNEQTYGDLGPLEFVSLSNTTQRFELFLSADVNARARLKFIFADEDAPITLDNIELVKVTGTPTRFEDKVRLELNPSKTSRSVSLDGAYLDINGERYTGSVNIEPYGSVVLFRED